MRWRLSLTILLSAILTLLVSPIVNAKPASGAEIFYSTASVEKCTCKILMRRGKTEFSTMHTSGSFVARYYDPRTSVWQSPDPILSQYMDGEPNGGVFNSRNLAIYSYTFNNPVNLLDSTGRWPGAGHHEQTLESGLANGLSIKHATTLANRTVAVDDYHAGKSFLPKPFGDQSYHFNTNKGVPGMADSRDINAQIHYKKAVALGIKASSWENTQGGFKGWVKNVIGGIYRWFSMDQLGKALHPTQDKRAHIEKYVKDKTIVLNFQYHDNADLYKIGIGGDKDYADDWKGKVPGSNGVARFQQSRNDTDKMIKQYIDDTNYKSDD